MLGLYFAGCAAETHDRVDDSPSITAKIAADLKPRFDSGAGGDVLVELDEQTLAQADVGSMSGSQRMAANGLTSDVGDVPGDAAEPLIAEGVKTRAEAYRALQRRVLDAEEIAELVANSDLELLFQYENLPLLWLHVRTWNAALALAQRPEVLRVHDDARLEHQLTESLPLIKQPAVASSGKTGAGTAVAVLDTGCDYTRAAFGSCASAGAANCKVAYAADFSTDDGSRDDNGHGTNVSAIVLGVAPGTKILALDVFSGSSAPSSAILKAVDWSITNRTTYNIKAMNLSLGGGLYNSACTTDVFATSLANARAAGILAAVASGNNGSASSLASPACVPAAVSVGAVYDASIGGLSYPAIGCSDSSTGADKIACFSNSTSFLSLLAPGAPITAGGYTMTGTSQASPHVAGALAVIRAAFPNESLNDSVTRLTSTGPSITDARNGVTKRRLDLQAAVSSGSAAADTTGPTGTLKINADAVATKAISVTLDVSASDPSGVPQMCVSNSSTCTTFVAFAASSSWMLASGDGVKTVWVTVKDSAGNKTVLSDTIKLDATAPSGGALTAVPADKKVTLTWSGAMDSGSGIASYKLVYAPNTPPACSGGTQIYTGTATSFVHTGLQNGAVYGYRFCPIDAAGNVGDGSIVSTRPAPEFDAPSGSVSINSGAAYVKTSAVVLTISAKDASGVASMCVSNSTTCATWTAYATSLNWMLGTANGATSVRVWFKDVYGNASAAPVIATTNLDTMLPAMGATFTATASKGQVALSWNAASDASGIASYTLVWQAGTTAPASCAVGTVAYTGTALAYVHTGRSKGSYSYRLCATDRAGNVAAGSVRSATVP